MGNGVGGVWSGKLLEAFGGLAAAVSERGVTWRHSLYLLFQLAAWRLIDCKIILGVAPLGGMGIDDTDGGSGHCASIHSGYRRPYRSQASQCLACRMSR